MMELGLWDVQMTTPNGAALAATGWVNPLNERPGPGF